MQSSMMLMGADKVRLFVEDDVFTPPEGDWVRRIALKRTVPGSGYANGDAPAGYRGVTVSGAPTFVDGTLEHHERAFLVELLERMKRRIEQVYSVRVKCGHASLALREPSPGMCHGFHRDHDSYGARDQWRSHTGILHINDDFTGGHLCVPLEGEEDKATAVTPLQGRMIGFDARELHGVSPLESGQRITLVGWYGLLGTTPLG